MPPARHLHGQYLVPSSNFLNIQLKETHAKNAGYCFSGSNPSKSTMLMTSAARFQVMKDRSAIVHLPPTSHSRFASTLSSTPMTRAVSFWYRSIALGSFSGWRCWKYVAWP